VGRGLISRGRGTAALVFLALLVAVGPALAGQPAPVVVAPADVVVEATGPEGATVRYRAARVRNAARVTYSKPSGSTFPLGTTVVTITARSRAGKVARARFSVRVADTTAPAVSPPKTVTAEATSAAGAVVDYTLPATTDVVDRQPAVACDPPPKSGFKLGTTNVTCTARDAAGNAATARFDVVVADTTAPTIAQPLDVLTAAFDESRIVDYALPAATDTVDANTTVACAPAPGSAFPVGTTRVTCTARDAAGNSVSTSFHVVVLRAPALPGTHAGTTAQGHAIWLTVYSDGITFGDIHLRVTASCPTGDMTLFVSPVNGRILLDPDGSFLLDEPMHADTTAVSGWVSGKLAGRFVTRESAVGTFEAAFDRSVGSRRERCFTGTVSWSMTRTAT
jgi:hypothetical protein